MYSQLFLFWGIRDLSLSLTAQRKEYQVPAHAAVLANASSPKPQCKVCMRPFAPTLPVLVVMRLGLPHLTAMAHASSAACSRALACQTSHHTSALSCLEKLQATDFRIHKQKPHGISHTYNIGLRRWW